MNCDLSRSLHLIGPANCSAEDLAALDLHLRGCAACSAFAGRDARFDGALRRAMADVPVPPGLNDRLLRAAFANRGFAFRKRFYQAGVLAAIIAVGILVANGVAWRLRPTIDSARIVNQVEQDRDLRQSAVSDWLTGMGLPELQPGEFDFDYQFKTFHGMVELEGRVAPMVLFTRDPDHFAMVYVIKTDRFNIDQLKEAHSSGTSAIVRQHPIRKDVYYFIIHSFDMNRLLKQINHRPV